ncbi:MAG: VOC family protein [Novosphingobium sp.]
MSVIKIEDIAHVRFAAPDLAAMRAFLDDFGMATFEENGRLYGRGADGRPFLHATEPGDARFLAIGLRAGSVADLEALAAFDGVTVVELDEPGGGKIVRLTDPDGQIVEVVAGQRQSSPLPLPADPPRNSANAKPRFRETVRLAPAPAHVQRIGHAVLRVRNFRVSEQWYKERFGFITSDEVEAAEGVPLGAFMRCNRGDKPADHHTIFLAQTPAGPPLLHAAFEVANLDDLMVGHRFLKAKKRTLAWGVGRHIMGSQIFDYWKDPFGNELEHWTDGDLFTAADPPKKQPMTDLLEVQWGAPHPMFAGKAPPPPRLVSFLVAMHIRARSLFRRNPKKATP